MRQHLLSAAILTHTLIVIVISITVPADVCLALWITDGAAVCTATGDQRWPEVVTDGAGGAIISWYDHRPPSSWDIYAQRVDGSGASLWVTDGVGISTANVDQWHPRTISDGTGGAIITWEDNRSFIPNAWDVYAQKVNAAGAVVWTTNGAPVGATTNSEEDPELASDGAGGAIIAWLDDRNGPYYSIYAQRVNAAGALQWTATGVPICTATNGGNNQQLAPDGAGGAIIVWSDNRNGYPNEDIYAQRVNAAGATLWAINGVPICTKSGAQWFPQLISDGAGGAIITWQDARSGADGIYAQRVNASGAVLWTADGVAICTATGSQWNPQLVSDGGGGAIIVWEDHRSGPNNFDVYAQRVNALGATLWINNGVSICTIAADQRSPRLATDGAGGAIITWTDSRNVSSNGKDIYAQRIGAAGGALWAVGGVPICTAADRQLNPDPVADGAGGAIIGWEDQRSGPLGDLDIYAQRVDSLGNAPPAPCLVIADHDVGNVDLSVTNQGIIGFLGSDQAEGSGLVFPRVGGLNRLFIGSLWAGTDTTYVLNRDYDDDPVADWVAAPGGCLEMQGGGPGATVADQDGLGVYTDAGHPAPRDLEIRQHSYAWAGEPDDDYVILVYEAVNAGSQLLEPLWLGPFMDWDLDEGGGHLENMGQTDLQRHLIYMWREGGGDGSHVGVKALCGWPLPQMSFVHNPTYVWPYLYLQDSDRFHFLSGDAPQYVVHQTDAADDWSAVMGMGPFALAPGDTVRVQFAVLAGTSLADLLANADAAQAKWDEIWGCGTTAAPSPPAAAPALGVRLRAPTPNPFGRRSMLRFDLPGGGPVSLVIYDVMGRQVTRLVDGVLEPGEHAFSWDGRDVSGQAVASGIYYVRLEAQRQARTRKLLLVR